MRGTTAFTSASWSTVSMPCRPRWSAVTLVTTETSLRVRPMPLSRMPPRAVSVTASSHLLVGEHPAGAARAGVVAGLDQLAVDEDAVGARPADVQARRASDVRDHPRRRGLAVGAGDRDHRDLRASGSAAAVRTVAPPPARRRRSRRPRCRRPAAASSTAPTARPISWARVASRQGNATTMVWVGGRAHPDGESRGAGLLRHRPHQPGDGPRANRCRKPESGSPGRAWRSPIRWANRPAVASLGTDSPVMSRVSLIAARGK